MWLFCLVFNFKIWHLENTCQFKVTLKFELTIYIFCMQYFGIYYKCFILAHHLFLFMCLRNKKNIFPSFSCIFSSCLSSLLLSLISISQPIKHWKYVCLIHFYTAKISTWVLKSRHFTLRNQIYTLLYCILYVSASVNLWPSIYFTF